MPSFPLPPSDDAPLDPNQNPAPTFDPNIAPQQPFTPSPAPNLEPPLVAETPTINTTPTEPVTPSSEAAFQPPSQADFMPIAPTESLIPPPPSSNPTPVFVSQPEVLNSPAAAFVPPETPPPVMTPPPPTPPSPAPATVPVKASPFKWVAGAVIGAVVLGVLFLVVTKVILPLLSGKQNAKTASKVVTISYQGLWESPEIMRPVLDEFEKENPNIKVDYQMQSPTDYRERLQTTIAQKSSPDVIRYHSTWLPMLLSSLQPAPADVLTSTDIQNNFQQVVSDAVVVSNQVYGVPLTIDGLALFINQSLFDAAQLQPPKTWEDLHSAAKVLTKKDQNGLITQAGVALGTTSNVDHWSDIVSLMALQAGGNLRTVNDKVGEALNYYALYANASSDYYSWNSTLPSSTQAFAAGKVAMIFAPSWRAVDIKAINPSLSWKIYPIPQLPQTPTVTWANFWVEGVPKNAAHPSEAWKLVKFLSTSQAQQLLYNAATAQRGYSQPPANKSLITSLSDNPIDGPYLQQAQYSQTFFTTSNTHDGDTGINSRLIKYLEDAVNSLNQNKPVDQVLPTVQQGFQQVLSQYGLVTSTPSSNTTATP